MQRIKIIGIFIPLTIYTMQNLKMSTKYGTQLRIM